MPVCRDIWACLSVSVSLCVHVCVRACVRACSHVCLEIVLPVPGVCSMKCYWKLYPQAAPQVPSTILWCLLIKLLKLSNTSLCYCCGEGPWWPHFTHKALFNVQSSSIEGGVPWTCLDDTVCHLWRSVHILRQLQGKDCQWGHPSPQRDANVPGGWTKGVVLFWIKEILAFERKISEWG